MSNDSDTASTDLIPPPQVVLDRLADNIREGRFLRALLRLARKKQQQSQPAAKQQQPRRE